MMDKKPDIVYVLKHGGPYEELRYSLRSIEKNLPHGKVFFFGGMPKHIRPDVMRELPQYGGTPWAKTTQMLYYSCRDEAVSEDFYLFNDDFFVMKPMERAPTYANGTIIDLAEEIEARHGGKTAYTQKMRETAALLRAEGLPIRNYALHVPILINKELARETIAHFRNGPMFRSLYGNYNEIPARERKDVKIYRLDMKIPKDPTLLSTNELTFAQGKVGQIIREAFPEKSRFEK